MSATQISSSATMKNTGSEAETDPAIISQNIDQTWDDMSETLDAIQHRLEPEQVTEYVKDVAHHVILEVKAAVVDLAGQAREAIREGAEKKKSESAASAGTSEQAKQKVSQTAGQMQEKAGQVGGKIHEKAGHVGEQMQEKAGQMQQQAGGLWEKLQANPVAVGAVGVALGAVIGAIVPETDKENQLMGETRDRVIGSVQDVAGQTIDSAKSAAKEAGDSVMNEAKSQGLSSG